MKALITKIQRFSLHDGPGIRTTVFMKGCPLSCSWCHNPETISNSNQIAINQNRCIGCGSCVDICPHNCFKLENGINFDAKDCSSCFACIDSCPSGAISLVAKELTVDSLVEAVARDRDYYDASNGGVTISGGEPLSQVEVLSEFLTKLQNQGFHTAVDTSGFASFNSFEHIISKTDLFLYDLKLIDPMQHQKYTGKYNNLILENLVKLARLHNDIIVRIPQIPNITDLEQNMSGIRNFLKTEFDRDLRIELVPFNEIYSCKYSMIGAKSFSPDMV